jgi:hypothetical protein
MPTYRFQEVSAQAVRNLKCACGKRFKRQQTFTNTINPFNKNKDTGQPKTYAEVYEDVKAKAAAWQPEAVCNACKEKAVSA